MENIAKGRDDEGEEEEEAGDKTGANEEKARD